MFKKILLASLVAASCGTMPLIAAAQQRAIVITQPPPPPRDEPMPGARHGQEWAPGYWAWRHGEHVWVRGHWMHERRGQHWVAHRWIERDGHWMMQPGHWDRGMRDRDMQRGMHDRDGDGVPNRFDSHPNNPNRN
jgi:hypothetical protein